MKNASSFAILFLLLSLAALGWGQTSPLLYGPLADKLKMNEVAAAIQATATSQGSPWAIFAARSQEWPGPYVVTAFLPPTLATSMLRRGAARILACEPSGDDDCLKWKKTGALAYVQVADSGSFAKELQIRSRHERPIEVRGKFSDSELLSLVRFIRSEPQLPKKPEGEVTFPSGVSRHYPVMWIERKAGGLVVVGMSENGGVGEIATVRHTGSGWVLVELVSFFC